MMDISFSIDGTKYQARYVGNRENKPGNWWYCDALDICIAVPDDTVMNEVIMAFEIEGAAAFSGYEYNADAPISN